MDLDHIIRFAGLVVAPSGAAWAGVRLALNGIRKDLRDIRTEFKVVDSRVQATREEMAEIRGSMKSLVHSAAAAKRRKG